MTYSLSTIAQTIPPEGEAERQLLLEQERLDKIRQQQRKTPNVHLDDDALAPPVDQIPDKETPCFVIDHIKLVGEE